MQGVYLPIITPFKNGEVDFESYQNLIEYYIPKGITGIIPLGTTGECPTVEEEEFFKIIEKTVETVNGRVPIYIGVGGNYTKKVVKTISQIEKFPIQGILSVCPYYNKPSQQGMYEHFKSISESTNLNIIIYNIPYRTGVNLSNEYLFKLAEYKNIVGVKDSCAIADQSIELIKNKPDNFYAFTGDDAFFFNNLIYGGDGGILASSHLNTEIFVEVFDLIKKNNHEQALKIWNNISQIIPYLFKEPNPAPLKYCLKQMGLIESEELRLPLLKTTLDLKNKLEKFIIKEVIEY